MIGLIGLPHIPNRVRVVRTADAPWTGASMSALSKHSVSAVTMEHQVSANCSSGLQNMRKYKAKTAAYLLKSTRSGKF